MRHAAPTALAASKPIHGVTHGPFVSKHRGQGIDFDDLRLYSPGDDIRHIDWKVTARYQQAHTRQYREERDSSITFAVDLRRAMYTGTDALRAVSAAHCCAALAWHAVARDQRCAVFVLTVALCSMLLATTKTNHQRPSKLL